MSDRQAEGVSGRSSWVPLATGVALGAALLLFVVLKAYCFNFTRGDEHLYNTMSLLILDGRWPYRDFFFAHPPLPIYLTAGIFYFTGFSLVASKAVPIFAAVTSGLHTYLLGRRTLGPVAGLVAAILFLFTFDVIRGSSHPTGANVAVAFILAGTYQVFARRFALGGVLLGCAAITGVYAVPMMLMLATLLALRSFRDCGRFTLGFVALTGSIVFLFALVTGAEFWNDVVGYSLAKNSMKYSWYDKFENVFFLNFHAMLGFLPAIVWAVGRWVADGREAVPSEVEPRLPRWAKRIVAFVNPWGNDAIGAAFLFSTFALGYFFFYSNLKVYYSYYFMLVIPWMALLTAYVVVGVVSVVIRSTYTYLTGAGLEAARDPSTGPVDFRAAGGSDRAARRKQKRDAEKRRNRERTAARVAPDLGRKLVPLIPTAVALLFTCVYMDRIGAQRMEGQRNFVRTYGFIPSPYLSGGINRMIERVFWSDVRDQRDPPRGITRYLQHETTFAPTIDRFIEGVRATCHPGDRIFGEYSFAPFAAAVSDCAVAANLIDMNNARISSGESTMRGWIEEVEADELDVAIWRVPSAYSKDRDLRDYIFGSFPEVVFEWQDPHVGTLQLRRRWR